MYSKWTDDLKIRIASNRVILAECKCVKSEIFLALCSSLKCQGQMLLHWLKRKEFKKIILRFQKTNVFRVSTAKQDGEENLCELLSISKDGSNKRGSANKTSQS